MKRLAVQTYGNWLLNFLASWLIAMLVVASVPVSVDFEFAGSQAEPDIESVEQLWQPSPSKSVRRRKSSSTAFGSPRDQSAKATLYRSRFGVRVSVGVDAVGVTQMKC